MIGPTRMIFLAAILFTWGTIEASEPNLWIPSNTKDVENPSVELKRIPPVIMPKEFNSSWIMPKEFKDGNIHPVPKSETVVGCGSHTLNPGETVIIRSKNYPNRFPKKYTCQWDFEASSPDSTISIFCPDFKLKKCKKTFVKLTGGDLNTKYCKNSDGLLESSTTNSMTIFFRSKKARAHGFECYVTASDVSTTVPTTTEPSSDCKCGHVNTNTRIVGGNPTEIHEYPWQVALTGAYSSQPYCGGSIISNQWILTAAHCMSGQSPSNNRVVIGDHKWNSYSETSVTERREISQIVMHPNYNSQNQNNDMALVKLKSPIEFNTDNKIAPVCLPPSGELYENVDATVTGWGTLSSGGSQPSQLYEVTVPTMSNNKCKSDLSDYSSYITTNMICAGLDAGGKDSCQGDSGGPLVTSGDAAQNFMIQIGVVSWGLGCADAGSPGIYARVNKYLDWIASTTSGSTTCPSL